MTEAEIKKMTRKNLTADEFISLCASFLGTKQKRLLKGKVKLLKNGSFLGIYKNKKGKWYRLHLQNIFFKRFDMNYSAKAGKRYLGKEIIISNMRLPKGSVVGITPKRKKI